MAELMSPGAERDFWQRRRESLVENVGRLHRAGVRLTAGSDAGWRLTRFDNYARELEQLQACGLTPLEVIHAATGAASAATGFANQFGTLREGLSADLLLVRGNAAEDVRHLANVERVYLEGKEISR
jgi:imidazolonepropionase-like amidohydrolase